MQYTKEIYDILIRGGFISQNSVDPRRSRYYDLIEDNFSEYQDYFIGIGLVLEGGNGYYYFSRTESKVDLENKLQRFMEWIDRLDFLKVFNSTFGPGFTFRKSNILEQFANDIELKGKAADLYPEERILEDKVDCLIRELERLGFIEMENDLDSTYRVTDAFHYLEEMIDCLTINQTDQQTSEIP